MARQELEAEAEALFTASIEKGIVDNKLNDNMAMEYRHICRFIRLLDNQMDMLLADVLAIVPKDIYERYCRETLKLIILKQNIMRKKAELIEQGSNNGH